MPRVVDTEVIGCYTICCDPNSCFRRDLNQHLLLSGLDHSTLYLQCNLIAHNIPTSRVFTDRPLQRGPRRMRAIKKRWWCDMLAFCQKKRRMWVGIPPGARILVAAKYPAKWVHSVSCWSYLTCTWLVIMRMDFNLKLPLCVRMENSSEIQTEDPRCKLRVRFLRG